MKDSIITFSLRNKNIMNSLKENSIIEMLSNNFNIGAKKSRCVRSRDSMNLIANSL